MQTTSHTINTQVDLNQFLNKTFTFPVGIDDSGPLPPRNKHYAPLRATVQQGFKVTAQELLHAIGCKSTALPSNNVNECINSAYPFFHLLDFSGSELRFRRTLDSDIQTARSQEIGIGMMCLFASRLWNIPWDQLESIPAPGKRFDYRGSNNSIRGIFEAKGTKYSRNQGAHIKHGVEKKVEHHKRGERYDVELIVSTCVAAKEGRSRIMVADPEFDFGELAFGPESSYFFRLRHYARILHYSGLTPLARSIYEEALEMIRPSFGLYGQLQMPPPVSPSNSSQNIQLSQIRAGERDYLGKWIDYQIPPDDPEPGFSTKPRKAAKLLSVFPEKLRLFQGIDLDIFESIQNGLISKLTVDSAPSTPSLEEIAPGIQASIFPDGSIMAASISEAGMSESPDIAAWRVRKKARNRIR